MTSVNTIPPDDGVRQLTAVDPDDETLTHVAVGSDTYTFLIRGEDTAGKYALIDMLISPNAGPPPHRHDFEEMFHVLEGEIEVTIRGETSSAGAGETINVPALAPHSFHNATDHAARLLCLVAPAGLEAFFAGFAERLPSRTSTAPKLTEEQIREQMRKVRELAPKYHIELL